MKFRLVIDPKREEEVVVYAHERNNLVNDIEELVTIKDPDIYGYAGDNIFVLKLDDVHCFAVEGGRVIAYTDLESFRIKQRLYVLEETVGNDFVKINQSCLANIKKIQRFDTSFAGTLTVVFKNGRKDYVSRRQIKTVKERFGIK